MAKAQEHLALALEREAKAQRLLLAGERERGQALLREAAREYRTSWEAAPPSAVGRLVGMLKAAIMAGDGAAEASYARAQLEGAGESPTVGYARAMAALVEDDDEAARSAAATMQRGGAAFARTADAIDALAARDANRYAAALSSVIEDFEQRAEHLTGVAVADTAAMLEELARRRSMAADASSPLLPP